MVNSGLKKFVKSTFNQFGFDLIRRKNSPALTLLGLRSRPIRTIIDVGANTGQFATRISTFFPSAKLYCFEPLPEPFKALSNWAKTQEGRVTLFNMAVGDKVRDAEMFLHEDHTPSSSLLATTSLNERYYPFTKEQKRIVVRQTTLDAAIADANVKFFPDTLIKLDVQGYEDRVLAGGGKTFAMASACILEVCLDVLYEGQARFLKLLTMLDGIGYRYVGNLDQVYGTDGHCIYLDAVFLRRD